MIIDFHTHAFADNIAERAMNALKETASTDCCTDGTVGGLRKKLDECGVNYGVMLPIATKPSQQKIINDWAKSENKGNIISFGTVHPDAEDVREELGRIKDMGLKGIKLHPDYQNAFLFEDKMKPIYERAEELGLCIVFHMGYDPVSPVIRHASPSNLPEITEAYPNLKIIAAHLGGMYAWEEVAYYVAGVHNRSIWLDTSYTADYIDPKLMTEIIKKHGAERILFASDCPWHSPSQEKALIDALPLADRERELIFFKNAAEILGVDGKSLLN